MSLLKSLLQSNVKLLDSASQLVAQLPDEVCRMPAPDGSGQRVGAQFRHVIEFYVCLIDGLRSGRVDYDSRARVALLENSRHAAISRMQQIAAVLSNEAGWKDSGLEVRMEDADCADDHAWMNSSVARELQAVRSHTIHHFALIALTLRAWGIEVDEEFGVAPSTLRHRAARAHEAA